MWQVIWQLSHEFVLNFRYAGLGAILLSGLVTVILVVLPREPKVSTEEQIAVVSYTHYACYSGRGIVASQIDRYKYWVFRNSKQMNCVLNYDNGLCI